MTESTTVTHVWNFETASQFVQSLAKQSAWRAFHDLPPLNAHMKIWNGSDGYVSVNVSWPQTYNAA